MDERDNHLRSWKDIAAYLGASERTVRRWERTRQLPVCRVGGGSRDAVFARRAELESWLASQRNRPGGDDDGAGPPKAESAPGVTEDASTGEIGPAAVASRSVFKGNVWLAAGCLAVLGLVLVATAVRRGRPEVSRAAPGPGTSSARTAKDDVALGAAGPSAPIVVLMISNLDGSRTELTVVDGGYGRTSARPGQPALLVRPHLAGARLLVEIRRADGQPVLPNTSPQHPLVIRLEQGVPLHALRPFPFDLEWIRSEPAPPRR